MPKVINEGNHPVNCTCKVCKAQDAETKKKGSSVKGKAGKTEKLSESVNILNFVKSLTEKNYAAANKYLQTAMNEKLKSQIAKCADIKPF